MNQQLNGLVILLGSIVSFGITVWIFYAIIKGAVTKALLKHSNAQLKILMEIAKASGVDENKLAYEKWLFKTTAQEMGVKVEEEKKS